MYRDTILLFVLSTLFFSTVDAAWSIGEPIKAYQGLKVKLDYPVQAIRDPEEVEILYFKDEECRVPVQWIGKEDGTQYFNADVFSGPANKDGTKFMVVNVNLEVEGISESEMVNVLNGRSYLAFCLRFQFRDQGTQEIKNKLDHEVIVSIDLENNIEITGFLEDEEQKFATGTGYCDGEGKYIQRTDAVIQGNAIRFCVSPDEFTQQFGVVINRIQNLYLIRDEPEVSRALIRDRGVIEDPRITEVICETASVVCEVVTTPSNAFYTSVGTIYARGEVVLMYNYNSRRRRMVRVPFDSGRRRLGNLAGLDAGHYEFGMNINVRPAEADHSARLYRCNERNVQLTPEEEAQPLYRGDAVRVCATANERGVDKGVFMHQVHSFAFTQPGNDTQIWVSQS